MQTIIIGASLNTREFCQEKAVIISIPKHDKNLNLPETYRPIALLSSLSKIYERYHIISFATRSKYENQTQTIRFAT